MAHPTKQPDGNYKFKNGRKLALKCDLPTAKKVMQEQREGGRSRIGSCTEQSASAVLAGARRHGGGGGGSKRPAAPEAPPRSFWDGLPMGFIRS